jgi:hypothetical protein
MTLDCLVGVAGGIGKLERADGAYSGGVAIERQADLIPLNTGRP